MAAIHFYPFVSTSPKYGICAVVGVNGTFDKMCTFKGESDILASTSVQFRPTTVQVPNLALIDSKRKKVYSSWGTTDKNNVLYGYL